MPVLPPSGQLEAAAARAAVPRCTTPSSRWVITYAVSARIASVGSGRFSSSTLPSRSVIASTWYGRHADALVGEHREGAGDLEQGGLRRAERRRQVGLHGAR